MKKQILTLLALTISVSLFGQAFKLTPNGMVNSSDPTNNYIVLDFPGKTQSELFNTSLIYFTSTYVSPKDVISKVDNEVLSINGFQRGAIRNTSIQTPFDINYTVVLKFKDGKVKIEQPSFNLKMDLRTLYLVYTGFSMNGQEVGIYGKNGKIKSEKAIGDLEKFFNDYVAKYKESFISSKKDNW